MSGTHNITRLRSHSVVLASKALLSFCLEGRYIKVMESVEPFVYHFIEVLLGDQQSRHCQAPQCPSVPQLSRCRAELEVVATGNATAFWLLFYLMLE